jgi:uncharacterized protein YyaL (SSP411 family)
MPNHLATETSPYLLQHAENPVDWYPWGETALKRARDEGKPIFLSIGYSACHWCHVMEHESFEDEQIAALLNENFVCIKVDREERPDLDQIYMTAVQLMTGRGGWPMSMFLTPEVKPFFGGTYWPPRAKMGMPGFDQVIASVVDAWKSRREQAMEQSEQITAHIDRIATTAQEGEIALDKSALAGAAGQLEQRFDHRHGGFGGAPKFPQSMVLEFLMRMSLRTDRSGPLDMVRLSLDKMADGGIYDQLAGGFARYSVDERWLVPHFEKMLYDNALLAHVYLEGFQATGQQRYAQVARETLDYVLNYLTDSAGGFHSTEDADSEGEEGKFYVWTPGELTDVLGSELAERFANVYDVSPGGNFEGKNILHLPMTIAQRARIKGWDLDELETQLAHARRRLLEARDQRVRPGKDDKVLVSWNGLMIRAMAQGGAILADERYVQAATRAAEFILKQMQDDHGRLMHCWRGGQAKLAAYLEDYACLTLGLVALYEATLDERWIDESVRLIDIVQEHFVDPDAPGFYFTSDDQAKLITRMKDMQDNATPCGNAVLATVLVRLGHICGREDYLQLAQSQIESAGAILQGAAMAAGQWLVALDSLLGPSEQIVIIGQRPSAQTEAVLQAIRRPYRPNAVVLFRDPLRTDQNSAHLDSLFQGRKGQDDDITAYVCHGSTCEPPLVGEAAIVDRLTRNEL